MEMNRLCIELACFGTQNLIISRLLYPSDLTWAKRRARHDVALPPAGCFAMSLRLTCITHVTLASDGLGPIGTAQRGHSHGCWKTLNNPLGQIMFDDTGSGQDM